MPRDNLLYLAEIVEAIDRISRWLGGIDEDGWDGDDMLQAAVSQQLTAISEAPPALVFPSSTAELFSGTPTALLSNSGTQEQSRPPRSTPG
jgi:uncharacterized protein with HEPN domain